MSYPHQAGHKFVHDPAHQGASGLFANLLVGWGRSACDGSDVDRSARSSAMIASGTVVAGPHTCIAFERTSADTDGALLHFEQTYEVGPQRPPMLLHATATGAGLGRAPHRRRFRLLAKVQ